MKNFFPIFFICMTGYFIFPFLLSAQSYSPFPTENATWNVTDAHLDIYGSDYAYNYYNWLYRIEGDTIIGGNNFHKLFSDIHSYVIPIGGDTLNSFFSYHNYAGAFRDDGFKHIYIRIPVLSDSLLYDFNLSVGDTTTTLAYYEAVVDSIDSIYANNHWYARFILHELYDGCPNISLMEGIGTSYGFINGVDCFEGLSVLNCFSENGIQIYGDSTIDCDHFVWTQTENIANTSQLRISPNPFTTSTTITLTNCLTPFSVQLFDELGREAPLQFHSTQQGSQTVLTIDRGALPSGMYFLSITSIEKREVVKVMVE
ncbi:MAG: T9SS type A sorting domain-containing protein [Chitinophagales bacterium]|nr:T9SS type A sorting domain-containing protein [Chitinophagales bacterium]